MFLSSNDANDSLTLYLAQQLINQSNSENLHGDRDPQKWHCKLGKSCSTVVSTQEEVNTIMILHAV